MARIQILIDYPVDLEHYPQANTKAEAMNDDVMAWVGNIVSLEELVGYAESAEVKVIEVEGD